MSTVKVTAAVPKTLVRLLRMRPFLFLLGALTGVSVTFVPYSLFRLGAGGAGIHDWRVLLCLSIVYFVPLVYMCVAAPVIAEISRGDQPS